MSRIACSHSSCNRSFESQDAMQQHYRDRHSPAQNNQSRLPCLHCNRSFTTQGGLADHLRAAHQLNQTDAASTSAAAPALPLQDLQVRDRVACNDCGKLFRSTDFLHQHQWDSANHTRVSKSPVPKHGTSEHFCSQCGAKFGSADGLEDHFMSKHPISEVPKNSEEGTWQDVEARFSSAWRKPTIKLHAVHRIFKVYNTGRRRKNFEEYRKQLKKSMAAHRPAQEDDLRLRLRVLKNGNELRRYHGTTVTCRLGQSAAGDDAAATETTASLCTSSDCNLCRILQIGFKKKKCKQEKFQRFGKGIYCSSISSKASAYVKGNTNIVKVMMVCKVLAGRPFHSTCNIEHLEGPPAGFHSVEGDPGDALNYEELVLYDDSAILPAFIILYSSSDLVND